jgi:hypothetical protein
LSSGSPASTDRYVRVAALSRRTRDAVVTLPLRADDTEPTVLTGSGAAIWDALAQPTTVAAATATVAEVFGIDACDIEESVRSFVDRLLDAHLVERCA